MFTASQMTQGILRSLRSPRSSDRRVRLSVGRSVTRSATDSRGNLPFELHADSRGNRPT